MSLIDEAVLDRTPMDSAGVTGARLERVRLVDGRVLVVKTIDHRTDWLMRATGDDGRIFRLWTAGVLQGLPAGIDCAVETVDERPDGWLVVMRDVASALVPAGKLLPREQSRCVIQAVSTLHDAFASTRVDGLCPLVDRLAFLTPASVRGVERHPLRSIVLEGWDRFTTLAPADVGSAVAKLLERPGSLAAALARYPETLLHGDLKLANIGFAGETVVLLDWGTLTGMGPRAIDHAWYLAVNSAAIDASLDEMLTDVESVLAPDDRAALPLALLGQVVLLGWEKALGATSDDPATAVRERAGLVWWCQRAAEALDRWSLV
jgi:hypothetical protein